MGVGCCKVVMIEHVTQKVIIKHKRSMTLKKEEMLNKRRQGRRIIMNNDRMDEVEIEQRAILAVLKSWTLDMSEDHYYLLKTTLRGILAYIMDNTDVKPEVNPLVAVYTK
jgi:NCAIR mutase (PurE)-related protein